MKWLEKVTGKPKLAVNEWLIVLGRDIGWFNKAEPYKKG